jgi:hypothetical protein
MATNDLALQLDKENSVINNRLLGVLAMIGAPMFLAEMVIGIYTPSAQSPARIGAFFELLYIFGWICGIIGMRQMRATGTGKWATILFYLQITGLALAGLLNIQDLLQITPEQSGIFYSITDSGYPLSHLLMTVVGIFLISAKVWRGLPVVAVFLVGLALPAFFAVSGIIGFEKTFLVFPILTALGFSIIGYTIFRQQTV